MDVFRITKLKYNNDLSGKGAEIFGGRWNPIGIPALYTSESRSLAVLEVLAHTTKELMPTNYSLLTLRIPKTLIEKIKKIKSLPKDWNSLKVNEKTQQIGRINFEENNELGIIVPSSIISKEYNIILNPQHKEIEKVKVVESELFKIDERVLL